jgi:hypothetical protein
MERLRRGRNATTGSLTRQELKGYKVAILGKLVDILTRFLTSNSEYSPVSSNDFPPSNTRRPVFLRNIYIVKEEKRNNDVKEIEQLYLKPCIQNLIKKNCTILALDSDMVRASYSWARLYMARKQSTALGISRMVANDVPNKKYCSVLVVNHT